MRIMSLINIVIVTIFLMIHATRI